MEKKKVDYSILVPCYNEEKRGRVFIKKVVDYFRKTPKLEVILINDGSKDKTLSLLRSIAKGRSYVRVLDLQPNRGKGGALEAGVFAAKGEKIIFIDADGSIEVDQFPKMFKMLKKNGFVIASRYFEREKVKQPLSRLITGTLFNAYVNFLYPINIKDTLCGFKGFEAKVARRLFKDLISKRWIFDVEIFEKARKWHIPVTQFAIHWEHKDDSKITLTDPLKMAWELLVLRTKI